MFYLEEENKSKEKGTPVALASPVPIPASPSQVLCPVFYGI